LPKIPSIAPVADIVCCSSITIFLLWYKSHILGGYREQRLPFLTFLQQGDSVLISRVCLLRNSSILKGK
jgi:hypothetical protein